MKRKVMNAGKLRLSPNEEAFVLKEDYERRRKLRLLQVREQERGIAFQIREDVKQRRNQQFSRLAEELRAEWEETQSQKIQNLEKLYLASLRHMGEGHRQAKENEPDLDALARRAEERKRKAEVRHKEALKVQKNQKEMLMKQKTRHIKARKEALLVEKKRSAKMARLPPPVPAPFESIEVNRIPSLKTNSSTYHHISTFVDRQMSTKQPDAHLAAEKEASRLEGLRKQTARERKEQSDRARVRGSQALKKIHLAQNQERLMEELKQLQKEDLARRRQTVAQMPPRLVELPYRRSEMKEDWQRELEFAFEDLYNADGKVKGDLILHLKPEPLPTMSDQLHDEELDLSIEGDSQVPLVTKTQQIPSRILFKRLLNKIRSQKSLWTIKSVSEDESEMTTSVSETESKVPSMESGAIAVEKRTVASEQEQVMDSDGLTIESGPLSSEDKPFFYQAGAGKEQAMAVCPPVTTVAQSSVLLHPQEEAVRIRMAARHKQIMEIEEQKQKQLELLEQIEQQKLRLETDCFRTQLEEEEKQKKTHQLEVCPAPVSHVVISDEDCHRQMIHNYQHQLLQQNRLHKQSVETARRRLLEYQTILKERCLSLSAASLLPDSVVSGPPQKSQKPAAVSEHWDPTQRLKLSPKKYQPVQPSQIPAFNQGHIQLPRQVHFPQRQGEMSASDMLAKQSVETQDDGQKFAQTEMHQRDCKFIPEDYHALSRTLSYDKPQTLQDAGEVSKLTRAITCQTLDSQQMSSEDSKNISSKPTEPSFLPLVPEPSFTSLPVRLESGKIQKPFTAINQSIISQTQDQPLSSSETLRAQQGDLKVLQGQLKLQKEVLQARQEAQEKLLLCTQKELEKHTGLPVFLPSSVGSLFPSLPSASAESGKIQARKPAGESDLKMQKIEQLRGWFPHIQGLAWGVSGQGSSSGEQPCLPDVRAEHSGESLDNALSGGASKPPVSKVKCGLDLNQHELSTIQEVETPASGRTSMPGKSDFYQDRDPLRVSVSREQSFLGSLLARDPFGCHQLPAQENSRSHDSDEAVKESDVENHALLSHAVSEEEVCTYLGPVMKPDDKAETQENSQELLSSVTVSTGSFLSYEITDLSLTDPESFSEQTEHQEQESLSKQGDTDRLSCAVPSTQVTYQQQHSLGAHESPLLTKEESGSHHMRVQQTIDKDITEAKLIPEKRDFQVPAVDLDFPELEHLFPHLHHQLFKPLEPHLDFDLSSSSGISQDNSNFYQSSELSSEKHVKASSISTICFTALRTGLQSPNSRLNQQLDVYLAHAAAQTSAVEGSEESFQQLLPELSQESQHADLPSIYSIEARGTSQSVESHNCSEQTEILQSKKKVHLQVLTENLSSACSSSEVLDQLHLQHSTPRGSTSSECSVKQLENKETLGFEELSRKAVAMSQRQRLTEDGNAEGIDSELYVGTAEMKTSIQGSDSLNIQNEKATQNIIETEATKVLRMGSQLALTEHIGNSKSYSFRSPIPVWETESGYGIMEEPDLTLVSTSDISITETDLANLTLEEKDNEAQSPFQANTFLPPTETSGYGAVSECCVEQPTVAPSAIPGSLQDAFMKRKRTFMERSYQRQRELRNKARLLQAKTAKEKIPTDSSLNRLKGVSRVSLPEERKAAQARIHQRALRLHRQLAEAREQRQEKQDACAQE